MTLELHHEVNQFLNREARLIDECRFEEWLGLFTEDAQYLMLGSCCRDQASAEEARLALIQDDKQALSLRVRRLATGMAHAEQPPSRTRHLITNVEVEDGMGPGEVKVLSNFLVHKSRLERDEEWFAGRREDLLRREDKSWKIARRKVVLDHNVIPGKSLSVFF